MILFSFMGMLDYMNPESNTSIWFLVVAALVSLVSAFFIGLLMMTKFLKAGFMVLGAVAGFFFGGIFYNLVLVRWV